MKPKLIISLLLILLVVNILPIVYNINDSNGESLIYVCDIDLDDNEKKETKVKLNNGKISRVEYKTIIDESNYNINKEITLYEGPPYTRISAVFTGNTSNNTIKLNKPSYGRMSGDVTLLKEEYNINNKEAIFSAKYKFPLIGITQYKQLILRISDDNKAKLYINKPYTKYKS